MGNAERDFAPGDWLAGYRIESLIGRGGMGVVYRARQARPDRLVAIKVISGDLAQDEAFRARFEREVSLAPEIEHPNVIPVYEVGEEDSRLYIVMRFVQGRDLSELCKRRGPFAPREAARLLTQIAQALDAAHARGVVHRDVKPANVLVTGADEEEHLYLTDFGIAKRVADENVLTATRNFVGTVPYISPEQINGRDVDARSDIYSLGCVLYELLVGAAPFRDMEELPLMLAHASGDAPPPPSSLVAGISVELDQVVARALAASPDDRFPSAGDLARATVAAATGGPNPVPERSVATGNAAPSGPPPPMSPRAVVPEPVPTPDGDRISTPSHSVSARILGFARRRRWAAVGLAAVLIALCALAISLWGGDDVISPEAIANATGTVTYCAGADVVTSKNGKSRQHQQAIDDFNDESTGVTASLSQFPEDATEQYERFSRDLANDHDCDVLYSDVTWTADFANNEWLRDLSPYYEDLQTYVRAMRDAAVFDNKTYGVPKQADAGLLYYRKDRVNHPPTTWQELYRQASAPPSKRLRYQALDYEGLTVAFLEVAYAAGADDIVTSDGKANLKQGPAYAAIQLMIDGIRKSPQAVPRAIVDQKEEENLRAFGRGNADFLRNWPYAFYALQDSRAYPKVARRVGVASLPGWAALPPASVLGGHVLVVSASSDNPAAALKLVEYLTSEKAIKRDATAFALAPALEKLWDDPDVQAALPAFGSLKDAVFNAKSRPVTPNYQAVSEAISKNVNRALRGQTSPDSAIDAAHSAIQQALDDVDG